MRQMKYLVVAIEYFTKWIEAEPVAHFTVHKVQHFVWKNIVWAYHTTPQSTTGEPFSLVYGSDAMIPVEIQENSSRFQNFMVKESNKERKVNLDLLDEARIKAEVLKRRVEYKYSSKLRPRQFQVVDLVMQKAHPYKGFLTRSPE